MVLIIAYMGKKGCVMVSDKRKINYFGNNKNLSLLKEDIYTGRISTEEELYRIADKFNINVRISDSDTRISTVGEAIKGEISVNTTFETKRKRIYGTTNGYRIVQLADSKIVSSKEGEKAIIVFGSNFAKLQAEDLISQKWKSSMSLKYIGDIFKEVISEIADLTPLVGGQPDILIKQPDFSSLQAQKYLVSEIEKDVKLLDKYKTIFETDNRSEYNSIDSKILDNGSIGSIFSVDGNMVEVKLNNQTQAFNRKGKFLAGPGEKVIMFLDKLDSGSGLQRGDEVVLREGIISLRRDDGLTFSCNILLCSLN